MRTGSRDAPGEEVYNAIWFARRLAAPPRPGADLRHDIDDRLSRSRQGRYPAPIAGVDDARIERWFIEEGDECRVVPEIRDMCVFSAHSVIKHPPFSRLDLISCRNLLIYVDPAVQDRVMRTFHYALKPEGHLFLGSSESMNRSSELFVARTKHRIFQGGHRGLDAAGLSGARRGTESKPAAFVLGAAFDDRSGQKRPR